MKVALGVWGNRTVVAVAEVDQWFEYPGQRLAEGRSPLDVIRELGRELSQAITKAVEQGTRLPGPPDAWLPPIPRPGKILCVGKNYADHAKEMQGDVPTEPLFFSKLGSTISAHEASIVLPAQSDRIDYEAELVVVMGRRGKRIAEDQALDFVAGYMCGNDVTARDWQTGKPGGQWLLGKSFDGFAPIGPWMVTAEAIPNPGDLAISLRLNGTTMQASRTSNLVFPIPRLISYVSQVCTLEPGDLIFTGTPAGVGAGRTPPVFLREGDVVEVEIERLGVLRNPVVAARSS